MHNLHAAGTTFEVGKAIMLQEGNDVTFVATGEAVPVAFFAAQQLGKGRHLLPRDQYAHRQSA